MFEHGVIVGKFAPLHKGHQFLIERAREQCRRLTVMVYANPDFSGMPQRIRANWLRQLYPEVDVREPTNPPPDRANDQVARNYVQWYLRENGIACDVVFTSENYGTGFAEHLGVEHRLVDLERSAHPTSGTAIRSDPYKHRHWLSPIVYRHFVRTVVFLGAESTGKSTLTRAAAEATNTAFMHEYGRDYYAEKNGQLDLRDYINIAKTHQQLEDRALMEARDFLFVDTNAVTTLFYSYYYNGAALPELHQIAQDCLPRYDLTFVCDTDIPFEQDGWRDSPILREKSQRMVLMDLNNRKNPYEIVSGSLQARLNTVLARTRGDAVTNART